MVDDIRVARLLRQVTNVLALLRAESSADERRRRDPVWLPGIKYLFVSMIEACVDTAQHICASEGWGPPSSNADSIMELGRHGAIDPTTADSLRRAVGFRNVLVHEYVDVDDDVVISRLRELTDIDAYVQQVASWLRGVET